MNELRVINIFQFIVLVLVQVLILDNILFLGYINPYIYIAFIILLPLKINRIYLLLLSFFLGLSIDFFSNTGGLHAASSLCIAYFRPIFVRLSFGINYDLNTIKLSSAKLRAQFLFIFFMVFIHHLIMFSLEYFSIKYSLEILTNTLYSGIFNFVLIYLVIMLTRKT
jgi:hypothetical protein